MGKARCNQDGGQKPLHATTGSPRPWTFLLLTVGLLTRGRATLPCLPNDWPPVLPCGDTRRQWPWRQRVAAYSCGGSPGLAPSTRKQNVRSAPGSLLAPDLDEMETVNAITCANRVRGVKRVWSCNRRAEGENANGRDDAPWRNPRHNLISDKAAWSVARCRKNVIFMA